MQRQRLTYNPSTPNRAQRLGEPWIDQRTQNNIRFTFSGKERDEETGYNYFGARYYNADISIWLSVDPMASERAWLTPYNYVQNNPIKLVDPTGMLDEPPVEGNFKNGQMWKDDDGLWMYNKAANEWMTLGGESGNVLIGNEVTVSDFRTVRPAFSQKNYNTSNPRYWNLSESKSKQWAYNQLNSFYLALQVVDFDLLYDDQHENPFRGGSFHNLDGSSYYADVTLDFVSNATILGPNVKMIPGNILNASQFSSMFKGTAIARSSPAVRGILNRSYNNVVDYKFDPLILTFPPQCINPIFESDE